MRETRFDYSAPVPPVADLGRVHVLAAGGAGMSAVARLLHAAGAEVSGSDQRESEVLTALSAAGIRTSVGHDPAQVSGADTVVVSSAIREDNPELVAARAAGTRVLHRSQGLAAALTGSLVIAVAGANGKTTTTAMLTEALVAAGLDPSYAIGGELVSTGSNAGLGRRDATAPTATASAAAPTATASAAAPSGADRPVFVVEADESDGSFVVYHPDVAVVTSVQPDHLDFYGSFEQVQAAYDEFVDTVQPGGLLVACVDDPGAAELAARARARRADLRVVGFGQDTTADVRIAAAASEGMTQHIHIEGDVDASFTLPMAGPHNALDAVAAVTAASLGAGADPVRAATGLERYAGVRRRFELKGEVDGVRVVDDYAHNPGKVTALVSSSAALAHQAGGRLVVVFQPHLYSRTRDFADAFGRALAPADEVVVTDVYAAREDPMPGVTGALVAQAVTVARGSADGVRYVPLLADVPAEVAAVTRRGDLVLTVGAGDVTRVGPQILQSLAGA